MAERFILKKSVRKGSFIRRIFWAIVWFVIIPLFIHTIFLYFREYQRDINDVKKFLDMESQDKVFALEGEIDEKKQLLTDLPFEDLDRLAAQKMTPDASKGPFFTRIDVETSTLWVVRNFSRNEAIGLPIRLDAWIEKLKYLHSYSYNYPLLIAIQEPGGKFITNSSFDPKEKRVQAKQNISDTGLILEFSVPVRAVQKYEIGYFVFSVLTLLVFILLIGGGSAILFVRRVARPFEALCRTMERVSQGAIHARYEPDKMGYEINTLGEQFNQTLDELFKRTEEVEKERFQREKLAQELRIGRDIQLSMLPVSLPSFSGLDVASGYRAAQEVSGDFYDLFQIDADRLLFVVADSAGKGISACLYGLGFRSALRALASSSRHLSEMIQRTNELFMLDADDSGFFITAWIGLYNAKTHVLEYCSQGHPPALLKRNGKLQELSTGGLAFGLAPLTGPLTEQITIMHEDLLLSYTDGVLETHSASGSFFGLDRTKEFLHSFSDSSSKAFSHSLLQTLEQFSENTPQHDDITFLIMKFFR